MIKAVIFDLDETLTDHQTTERKALKLLKQNYINEINFEDFYIQWNKETICVNKAFKEGKLTLEDRRSTRIIGVWKHFGHIVTIEDSIKIHKKFIELYQQNISLFSDVKDCLLELRDYKLGIVTNGNANEQRQKLKATELEHTFHSVCISEEIGVKKPNPLIFEKCLQALGVTQDEAIFVGDRIDKDIKGAIAAGVRSMLINRTKSLIAERPDNMIEINSLNEIPMLLKGTSLHDTK